MIDFDVKYSFFDKDAVKRQMDSANYKAFNRFGAATRLTAQRSMRKGRKGTAPAGSPPYAHGRPMLRQHIYYAFDVAKQDVVIGPVLVGRKTHVLNSKKTGHGSLLNLSGTIPHLQEFGGESMLNGREAYYRPHPFMRPAFNKILPKLKSYYPNGGS